MKSDTLPKKSTQTVRTGFAVYQMADFTGIKTRVSPVCFTKRTLRKFVATAERGYNPSTANYQLATLKVLYDVEFSHVIRLERFA